MKCVVGARRSSRSSASRNPPKSYTPSARWNGSPSRTNPSEPRLPVLKSSTRGIFEWPHVHTAQPGQRDRELESRHLRRRPPGRRSWTQTPPVATTISKVRKAMVKGLCRDARQRRGCAERGHSGSPGPAGCQQGSVVAAATSRPQISEHPKCQAWALRKSVLASKKRWPRQLHPRVPSSFLPLPTTATILTRSPHEIRTFVRRQIG